MAQHGDYKEVIVESFSADRTGGLHGGIHIRPIADQPFPQSLQVECSKRLMTDYPVGTRFKIRAKITDREGEGDFLYTYFGWPVEVLHKG